MPEYKVSFKIVIGKKDSTIHVIDISHNSHITVCGIPEELCHDFILVTLMGWCPKCHNAYLTRDSKEFAHVK